MNAEAKEKKKVISPERAEDIFQALLDHYDLDINLIGDESAKRGAVQAHNKIRSAIEKGMVEIEFRDDSPTIIQHLSRPIGEVAKIEYGEVSGRAKIAMKDCSENDNYGKIYALLGAVANLPQATIIKLKGKDMSIAECIGALFLQV